MIAREGWPRSGRVPPRASEPVFSPRSARSSRQPLPAPRAQLQAWSRCSCPAGALAPRPSRPSCGAGGRRGAPRAGGGESHWRREGSCGLGWGDPRERTAAGARGIEGDAASPSWNTLGASGGRSAALGLPVPVTAAGRPGSSRGGREEHPPRCHRRAALEWCPGSLPRVAAPLGPERGRGLRVVRAQPPAEGGRRPRPRGAAARLPAPSPPPPLMAGT